MNEDEGTNASAQGVPSEDRPDDGDGVETEGTAAESESEPAAEATDENADASGESPAPETSEDVQELLDRIAEHDDDLAGQVEAMVEDARGLNGTVSRQRDELEELRADLEEAEAEIEDLESRLKRKQADFQNYKKRAKKRQKQMEERATENLVERLVGVRDNLKRALEEESDDVESLREGVEMTMREFDRVLEDEDVTEIDPDPGTEADPQRHEVMMQVDSAHPEGTVADVYTPGYEMGEKVIQNAQVTVSNGELECESDGDTDAETDDAKE
jgi:molecular chaperone GrpE